MSLHLVYPGSGRPTYVLSILRRSTLLHSLAEIRRDEDPTSETEAQLGVLVEEEVMMDEQR